MDKLLAGKAGKMAVEELAEVLLNGLEEGEGRLVKRARVHEVVLANLQVHKHLSLSVYRMIVWILRCKPSTGSLGTA
jgi:hypothetical protein